MAGDAPQIFDAHVSSYDAARRRLVPSFERLYGAAVDALGLCSRAPRRVLDLGAGTGLLSQAVRAAHPGAELVLLDGAGLMLDEARARLGDDGVRYVEADMTAPLPDGRWDAVVSALAIHHLDDTAKQRLFRRVRAALEPGGVFVNVEQVAGSSDAFTALYDRWHEACARAAGSDDAEWSAAVERMAFDRCASVEDQLGWLRDAGFEHADCLFKDHCFAVLAAF